MSIPTSLIPSTRVNRTYRIWAAMKGRCQRKTSPDYARWGGRGISVCKKWQSFSGFYEDMGDAPIGLTLDRIDPNGNYEPGNCRWASRKTQARNKTNNRLISFKGVSACAAEWGEISGLNAATITRRIGLGWSPEKAIPAPQGSERKNRKFSQEDIPLIMEMHKSGMSFRSIGRKLNATGRGVCRFLERMGVDYAGR